MYIGKVGGSSCQISGCSINRHICLTGISGSGKTSRLNQMELAAVKEGVTVVILDLNRSHADERIFLPVQKEYLSRMKRIDARSDGLNISFLGAMKDANNREEDFVSVVNAAVYALGLSQKMGARQMGVLREAVIFAIGHLNEFPNEMAAVGTGILQQDNAVARSVYERLWVLLNGNLIRRNSKCLEAGKVNIISFCGIDRMTQSALAECFLSYLWRAVRYQGKLLGKDMVLVIDEFQNLSFREGAIMWDILREGRKFNVNLWLATQSLGVFSKDALAILNQASTRLYFRPAVNEISCIAKEIDIGNMQKWRNILSSLKVGEALATGNFCVGTQEINRPIVTH